MTAPIRHRLHWTWGEREGEAVWYARLAHQAPPVCWLQRLPNDIWLFVHLLGGKRIETKFADEAKLEAERLMGA